LAGGNWKCNGTKDFARNFTKDTLNKLKFDPKKVDVVVCPAALHIPSVLHHSKLAGSNVNVGAQNISLTGNGAYTGEFSCEMVKDIGLNWCLTGHSERRSLYGETDAHVALKTKLALGHGFSVIACIGEYLEEREAGKTRDVNER